MAPRTTQTPTGRVALVRTSDRAEGVRRAIEAFGRPTLSGHVVIKPNLNSADPAPGSTHPDVLRALVGEVRAAGAERITVADRSGMGDTREVMEALGVFAMGKELGFDVVVLDELPEQGWYRVRPKGSHWKQGFPFPTLLRDADHIVQACCLKTHRFGGHFTMSLKNSVGMVAKRVPGDGYDYMRELHGSAYQREMIAEANAAYRPALVVMDGVTAFVSGGPDQGESVDARVFLAATDRVALDAVGIAILRHFGTTPEVSKGPVFGQAQLARAAALGLGVAAPDAVELVAPDDESAAFAKKIEAKLRAR